MEEFILRNGFNLVVALVTIGSIYSMLNTGLKQNAADIKRLMSGQERQDGNIVRIDKELVRLARDVESGDRRLTEITTSLKEAIQASEARVIAHVDTLIERLSKE